MSGCSNTGLPRREALRRAALLAGMSGLPFSFAAATEQAAAPWIAVPHEPAAGPGYGTDPDLLHPLPVPWPNTLDKSQRALVSTLADILIPAEGGSPSATDVGVTEVLDEWLSAPYPDQQAHRGVILAGLDWCNREAGRRFGCPFVAASATEQLAIVDDIAFPGPGDVPALTEALTFFDLLRRLVTGIFYTSPEGVRELGYQGNVALSGDYPGPSAEAMNHLQAQLDKLGLTL